MGHPELEYHGFSRIYVSDIVTTRVEEANEGHSKDGNLCKIP